MIEGIEPYYEKIGVSVKNSISEEWESAFVTATFYSEHIDFENRYVVAGDTARRGFFLDKTGRNTFREMRTLFMNAGKAPWCRATFSIHADGKFKMNFDYDGCDEKGFARFDEEAERDRS